MNKKIIQFSSIEELVKSLEEYSGSTCALEDVDTHEKLLNKISQIQGNLSNEVSEMCSHYRDETERLTKTNCALPELTSKEELLEEDEFSSYLKTKWRQLKSGAVTAVIVITVLVFLFALSLIFHEGKNAQILLYTKYGIWFGR